MRQFSTIKNLIITAECIALCVVLPMALHAIPNAGTVLSPMHIPALLCGLICGWRYGLLCGFAGPIVSSLLTGMPSSSYLFPMMIELAVYGLITGLLMQLLHTKKSHVDLYISLLAAMIVGRIVAGLAKAFIFTPGQFTMAAWISGYFVTSFPGIIIQLALIPSIVFALERARLIPSRY